MRFLFTCGGTAGHINPAIGVAGKLASLVPGSEFLFVGADGYSEKLGFMANNHLRVQAVRDMAEQAVRSGTALERFAAMIAAQGGDASVTEHPEKLALSRCERTLTAENAGWIAGMQSEEIGRASVLLGAGRMKKTDSIDFGAGIRLHVKYGDAVEKGAPLLTMYADREPQLDEAEVKLREAVTVAAERPAEAPLIRRTFRTGADT